MGKVTPDMTKTPKPFADDYDWRTEPWVDDERVRDLAYAIAGHVLTAMMLEAAGDPNKVEDPSYVPTPAEEQDARVFALLRPDVTERIFRSRKAGDHIRFREWTAAAQGVDLMITEWLQKVGSIDAALPKVPKTSTSLNYFPPPPPQQERRTR